jgi:hypothetical protein
VHIQQKVDRHPADARADAAADAPGGNAGWNTITPW